MVQPTMPAKSDGHHHSHCQHSTTNSTHQQLQANAQTMLDHFRYLITASTMTSNNKRNGLKVLELGAGIGFTSLELAYPRMSNE